MSNNAANNKGNTNWAHAVALLVSLLVGCLTAFPAFCYLAEFLINFFNLRSFGGIVAYPVALIGAGAWFLAVVIIPQLVIAGGSKKKAE